MGYSSQSTIQASSSFEKLRAYSDKNKDGVIDSTTVNKAINDAEGVINSKLYERYGSTLTSCDETTSVTLTMISDAITLYFLALTNNAVSLPIDLRYKAAMAELEAIREYKQSIPELSDANKWETTTEDLELTETTVDDNPYYPRFDDFNDEVPIVIWH